MRLILGIFVLVFGGIVALAGETLVGLVMLAFGISALIHLTNRASSLGQPGGVVATLLGALVAVMLLAFAIDSFHDDC